MTSSSTELIKRIKNRAININASDIFFSSGSKPACKIYGKTKFFEDEEPLNGKDIENYLLEVLSDTEKKKFREEWELDFSLKSPGEHHFRVNVVRQLGGLGMSFRVVPKDLPKFDELNLPEQLKNIVNLPSGLVLITGSIGSGKSTTLAALLDIINKTQNKRIITIEDPVEFIHKDKNSIIEHRELGVHTHNFKKALRSSLRQGADVILIGELRDLESIALAITAAETGTLVLSTLHTYGAVNTISRLIDVFPYDQQGRVQSQLSQSLRAVAWQTLIPNKEGNGRIPSFEILFQNHAVSNLIREGKIHQIGNVIETSVSQGMIPMRKYLNHLLKQGLIDKDTVKQVSLEDTNYES